MIEKSLEIKMDDLLVKSNRLNTATQNLSLVELRLIQLAIIDARETNTGLVADKPLRISARRYSEAFGTDIDSAYDALISAESTLFERRFSFINERKNPVKTRWISQVEYLVGNGGIEIILTPAVVNEMTRIDGKEQFFTKYMLGQTASLNSVYSVRLYELLIQWRQAKKTPLFVYETLRGQLGLGVSDYSRMSDFKRRVLHHAIDEINDKTDLKVSYEQKKDRATIVGFKFKVLEKPKPKPQKTDEFKELNNKQIDYFGALLSKDATFGSKHSKIGESAQAFETRIKNELKDINNQQKWLSDLLRIGFEI